MTQCRNIFFAVLSLVLISVGSTQAAALCAIVSASVTPLASSTGTYLPPSAPTPQSLTLTISGTFLATVGDIGGNCAIAVAFNRTSLPASMALTSGGTATMPYDIQATSGGNSLLNTGAGFPSASSSILLTFPATTLSLRSFNLMATIWTVAQPTVPQQAGSYSDIITVRVYASLLNGLVQSQASSQTFIVTGQVAKSCTIGGLAQPSADTATIPINSNGSVNTAPINRTYSNAVCNAPSNLQLVSRNGALTTTGAATGLQNVINYFASASFASASTSLDTSSVPGATGSESSITSPTSGSLPSGNISVTITPESAARPLIAGAYADTLTITITPQ